MMTSLTTPAAIIIVVAAIIAIIRHYDVRLVLFTAGLLLASLAGKPLLVFTAFEEKMGDGSVIAPIWSPCRAAWWLRERRPIPRCRPGDQPGLDSRGVDPGSVSNLLISEVFYDPTNAVEDAYEWVELFNPGATSVTLNGWSACATPRPGRCPAHLQHGARRIRHRGRQHQRVFQCSPRLHRAGGPGGKARWVRASIISAMAFSCATPPR